MLADWEQLGLHDSVQCHSVDGNARSLSDNDEQTALELEIDEQGHIVGAFLTLGQLGEDQEASITLTAPDESHTLPNSSQRLEVAFCDAACSSDTVRSPPSVNEEDV
jgi:hypothetical protein